MIDLSNGSTNPYTIEARHNLIPTCRHCKKFIPVILDGTDYFRYFVKGEGYVQTVFPYLNEDQREILVSGIHPKCWNEMFGGAE